MRPYILAVLLPATLGFGSVAAQANKPLTLHCKHGYVKKLVTIKEHKRGRTVKVKVPKCVKKRRSATTTPAAAPPPPAPTPAPATPKPTPKPEPLEIRMGVWDPINVENPEYNKAQAGKRFVAVELSLTNISSATVSSDANLDAVVIGTDGQSYTFALGVERKGCSDFAYGSFTLSPGAHQVGCVVYELPTGVQVAKVQWGLNGEVETTRSFGG